MAVLHQMGYHSNNLIDLPALAAYAGAIFSPVNCSEAEASGQITEVRGSKKDFEIIFDPQLYVPSSAAGKLRKWAYFPKDFDTADPTSAKWWGDLSKRLARVCEGMKVNAVCSPSIIPKVFDDKYYAKSVAVGNELRGLLSGHEMDVLQTVLVNLADLTGATRALEVASIISRTDADRVYLVLIGTTFPRRELSAVDELLGAMRLINALERNKTSVVVGFCSSDLLLWKTAGASACCAGKFFNLRRFTRQRFEEAAEGGGQLPYWFEESLLAFLRQGDLLLVRRHGFLGGASSRNPFAQEILAAIDEANRTRTKPKWLGNSWRQFLFWFADVEGRLARGRIKAEGLLTDADSNWSRLDQAKVLMEERENNGTWVRSWLNTLREYEAQKV